MKSLAILLVVAAVCSAQTESEKWLLPDSIRPINYDLELVTQIEKFNASDESSFQFEGIEVIQLEVVGTQNVSQVVFHRDETINIVSANIRDGDGQIVEIVGANYDPETNKQTYIVESALRPGGSYFLYLNYTGLNINDTLGFYRSSYRTTENELRWVVTTHFESAGARRAYPCFDEPRFKATYTIVLNFANSLYTQGYRGLSNAEIETEFDRDGRHLVQFKKTLFPISSYLVAFIVSDFAGSAVTAHFNSSFDGTDGIKPFRTWAQPNYIEEGRDYISQKFGPAILELYTSLFKQGFAYNKVDQAALPDFRIGAMENWGLVTYRDIYLLPALNSSILYYMQAARFVCHELAHQWFGDAATLHWWSDIWLNEGFADYFEYFGTDQLRFSDEDVSTWDLPGQFITAELQPALSYDYGSTSRALTSDVWSPEAVDANFDDISYSKGGSILRMWQHSLGGEIYYHALQLYLQSRKFDVGYPEDLMSAFWLAIENTPILEHPDLPVPVIDLLVDWHLEPGYPLLNVTVENGELVITQKRFAPGNDSAKAEPSPWFIPITYSTDKELRFDNTTPTKYFWKGENVSRITLENPNIQWVIVNNQEAGFYRVNYDLSNWNALFAVLNNNNTLEIINPINRAQIIDDALNIGINTEYLPVSTVLDILTYLRHEKNFVPWRAGSVALRRLLDISSNDREIKSLLKGFAMNLVETALKNSFKDDNTAAEIFQEELTELLVYLRADDQEDKSRFIFFEDRSVHGRKRSTREKSPEVIEVQTQWLKRNRLAIINWLQTLNKTM